MKKYLLFVLFVTVSGFSQTVNNYQYVVVPTKFSIFKENDKYRLNTYTKLLLEKYGFKVFMSTDAMPNELGGNCTRLYADLVDDKSFLVTKVKIVLKDCKEKIVFETDFGKSREKDYAVSYNLAFREAAQSFDKLNYKYNGGNETTNVVNRATIKENNSDTSARIVNSGEFYFAQPTANGFQVVDTTPKIIMHLFNTSDKNVFMAERGAIKGMVISKNGQWFFEYYENSKLVSEPLNLKF